ncbi:type IV secretion system protein (plasmid) [Methylomonas sp. EFPC1]|uniref:Type IV secretion system protein n=1 Tax=Methylomonas rosea TaxID=2952227 RepID=A0ABT1TVI4_9GAMM|nr:MULTISPECIES: type IV secretion system protein [unclassified Methylomonas]MCQ8118487.1 type IV secretion system protein [Methylomonas sp. WSC-7]PPD24647.1 MAG: conjugal transfer protein TrbL [Methylobacter sp.]QSB03785.1 type IV secretion system protein [Methylomonas sp. EFPC1]
MGFFLTFWNYLQTNVLATISTVTANIANSLQPAAVTFATMYVMLWGYLHLRGSIEEPIMDGTIRIIRLAAILGVALSLWEYNTVLVDFFITTPASLSDAILGGNAALNIVDTVWQQGAGVAESLTRQGGATAIDFYLAGIAVYLFVGFICVWMAYLYCLSLVAVGFLLAIGPLFILGLMFETTKRFFESWMAQLSNYALIIVIAAVAAKILLNMLQAYAADAAAKGMAITIAEAAQLCLASFFILLFMRQVPTIAASLGSGVALGTFNALSRLLKGAGGGAGRSLYQFGRGVADGRAGEKPSRYQSLTRNLGNRLGARSQRSAPTGGKIQRSNVF